MQCGTVYEERILNGPLNTRQASRVPSVTQHANTSLAEPRTAQTIVQHIFETK